MMGDYLRLKPSIGSKLSKLIILVTAREWTQDYEWYAHAPIALKQGISQGIIDAIAAGQRPSGMNDFSMPSTEMGAEVLRKLALNCWPWVRSFTQSPAAVIHSPAEIAAAWPTTVISSRWPRALTRMTQNPFSAFW
jgi:hypothetical protein